MWVFTESAPFMMRGLGSKDGLIAPILRRVVGRSSVEFEAIATGQFAHGSGVTGVG
jgi:hypothetical protein